MNIKVGDRFTSPIGLLWTVKELRPDDTVLLHCDSHNAFRTIVASELVNWKKERV